MPAPVDQRSRVLAWLVGTIAAVSVIWLLRAASLVAVPVAAAFFIVLVVHPVQSWLQAHVPRPRWAAPALAMATLCAAVGAGGWAIGESIDEVADAAPKYMERIASLWTRAAHAGRAAGLPVPDDVLASADVQRRLQEVAASAARMGWEVVSGLVLVFFLVLLMLFEAADWRGRMHHILRHERGATTLDTVAEIAAKVRGYLYVRSVLGVMSAIAAGAWLLVLDIDLVLVWVTLTFLLNYIPNLGSVVAVVPPSLMAFLQHGPIVGAVTLAGLTVIEQVIGNFIDPRMQGRRLQISPVVVLVALVFWTWVWGPIGALLAMPMTVALLAVAAHVPGLARMAEMVTTGPAPEPAPVDRGRRARRG